MKCPKCGFSSFDGLDSCKKCGADLEAVRERFGLTGRLRRNREPHPVSEGLPAEDGFAELDFDLPFETESGTQEAESAPVEEAQGRLFFAFDEEIAESEPLRFQGEVGEEFSPKSVEESDVPAAPFGPDEAPEEGAPPACSDEGDTASQALWKPRLLASVVDLFVLTLLVGLFVLCGSLALSEVPREPSQGTLLLPFVLVAAAVCFVYFTFFHYLTGQSPGKMVFGLLVERKEGGPLSFSQAFLRSFGGGLSLLGIGLGFLAIVRRSDGRGWNDRLAGSHVVSLVDSEGDDTGG